jgi:hypothetical protein
VVVHHCAVVAYFGHSRAHASVQIDHPDGHLHGVDCSSGEGTHWCRHTTLTCC